MEIESSCVSIPSIPSHSVRSASRVGAVVVLVHTKGAAPGQAAILITPLLPPDVLAVVKRVRVDAVNIVRAEALCKIIDWSLQRKKSRCAMIVFSSAVSQTSQVAEIRDGFDYEHHRLLERSL